MCTYTRVKHLYTKWFVFDTMRVDKISIVQMQTELRALLSIAILIQFTLLSALMTHIPAHHPTIEEFILITPIWMSISTGNIKISSLKSPTTDFYSDSKQKQEKYNHLFFNIRPFYQNT